MLAGGWQRLKRFFCPKMNGWVCIGYFIEERYYLENAE